MTSPRSYDGVGYYPPSFSSGTPIYDSLVAERGVPQIAPINVPPALPPAGSGYGSGSGFGFDAPAVSNLPALPPARLALGPGPSSAPATNYQPAGGYPAPPAPGYGGQQYLQPPRPQPGAAGFPQQPGYASGQSFGGQNTFVQPQAPAAPGYGTPGQAPQGYAAPVSPVQPQRPGGYPAQYPQQGYQRAGY